MPMILAGCCFVWINCRGSDEVERTFEDADLISILTVDPSICDADLEVRSLETTVSRSSPVASPGRECFFDLAR